MTAQPQSQPKRIGRYKIISLVAVGGMGSVYKGEDPDDGKTVAVKVMPEMFSRQDSFVERFKREARIGMSLSHDAIPKVYDFGVDADRYYLAMEWLDGKSLRTWIEENPALLPDEKWRPMFIGVCNALAAAHDRGILHRDLTEGNVILTADGKIRITDFGLSTMVREAHFTLTGDVLGTPHYSAPEQIQASKDVTVQADIWSLGVIGYQMATRRRPFEGDSPVRIIEQILNPANHPDPVRSINPDISIRSESVIQKCLQRDRSMRYESIQEILADLGGSKDEPVSLPAIITQARSKKWIGFAAGLLIAAAAAGVWVFWPASAPTPVDDAEIESDEPDRASDARNPEQAQDDRLPGEIKDALKMDANMIESMAAGKTAITIRGATAGLKPGSTILLYPISSRDKPEMKPAAAGAEESPVGAEADIRYAAVVVLTVPVGPEEVRRLDPFMAYTTEYALQKTREARGRIRATVLRVYRLAKRVPIWKDAGGARIKLETPVSSAGAMPVLSDADFSRLRENILLRSKGDNPFRGKRICLAGKLRSMNRETAEAHLRRLGAAIAENPNPGVDLLVVGKMNPKSKSPETARQLGIPTISGDQFEFEIRVFGD